MSVSESVLADLILVIVSSSLDLRNMVLLRDLDILACPSRPRILGVVDNLGFGLGKISLNYLKKHISLFR